MDASHFLAKRLESLGLASLVRLDPPRMRFDVTDVGRRFRDFVWDEEMWQEHVP